MSSTIKNEKAILAKLKIDALNPMQIEAQSVIANNENVILLSPTGTGKTLAFLLPLFASLNSKIEGVQALILTPSRELAIQIEQVAREMGSGFKINVVYGGRAFSKDKVELAKSPAVLIGTPGRIADHLRRGTVSAENIVTIVLDEFDKSLEVGFEEEMSEILGSLNFLEKRILTSATQKLEIPEFVKLTNPAKINYLQKGLSQLKLETVLSEDKNKLSALAMVLNHNAGMPGIVFCNFKDTINFVSDFLNDQGISHGCFYGGMEQKDRERALIKFRNGTHKVLIATDLAARGIDVPEMKFIIHYQLPLKREEFTHRNGRTARMKSDGTAYVLKWKKEDLPSFIENAEVVKILDPIENKGVKRATLFISGGRKDKISKGDIAGLFFKQGKLKGDELGVIEIKHDCAFVSVPAAKAKQVILNTTDRRLKKKKVRVSSI